MPQLLDEHKRDIQLSLNCVQIGIIEAFDLNHQTATVKIALKQVAAIDPDGTRTIKEYPLVLKCPVMTLFGGVDFLSMPITAGDNCIVLFNDREIDNWLHAGNGQTPTTPRLHDISDVIAIVGIRPLTNSIVGFLANGIRLSHGGGNVTMDLKTDLIETLATLFLHHGNVEITGNTLMHGDLTIKGTTYGNDGDQWIIDSDIVQQAGRSIHAGNGANGTFGIVTVVDGIVISGSPEP